MTKSERSKAPVAASREPRALHYLKPATLPLRSAEVDVFGLARLSTAIEEALPRLVRSLVDFTIARQNQSLGTAAQPIPMSVLNRRRRAARAWLLAVAEGRVDGATRHAVASQWLPMLCGTGPDLRRMVRPGRALIEFVRGAITACLFDAPQDNLLPHARALFVLESTLAAHLAAVCQHGPRSPQDRLAVLNG